MVSGGNFLTTVLLGRSAGLDGLGVFSLCFTLFVFLCAIQESLVVLPYTVYGHRLDGEAKKKCKGAAISRQILMAIASMAVVCLAAASMTGARQFMMALVVLAAAMPAMLFREFGRRMAFADLQILPVLLNDALVTAMLLTGLVSLAYWQHLTAVTAIGTFGAASALGTVIWYFAQRHQFIFDWQSIYEERRRSLSLGGWALGGRITSFAESYSVHWLIAIMLGTAATGGFSASMTIVALSNPLLLGVGSILTPYGAKLYREKGSLGLRQLARTANMWLMPTMFCFAIFLFIFGDWLLIRLYGSEVIVQSSTVPLLAIGALVATAGMTSECVLRVTENTRPNFLASLGGVCVTVILALVFMKLWGIAGAALGMVLGSATSTALRWLAARSALRTADTRSTIESGKVLSAS